jgi:hypothetical protein
MLAHHNNTSYDKIVNTTIRPTDGQSFELGSILRGLALFFSKLVLEPLLLGSRRLMDLLELLLKLGNPSLPLRRIL